VDDVNDLPSAEGVWVFGGLVYTLLPHQTVSSRAVSLMVEASGRVDEGYGDIGAPPCIFFTS
jgi:hypothetical protein